VSAGRLALLEELLGREGLDDSDATTAKCRKSRRRRLRGASWSGGRTEEELVLLL
jgi:hypothetical protein